MNTDDELRPRPEKFLSLIREQKTGRLKIYLGFAPGVGKTFEMLQEAWRLKRQATKLDAQPGCPPTTAKSRSGAKR